MHSYILPAIVILISTIIGDFGNLSIIWATIKNKNLQNPCNILIAANAFADSATQFAHYIFAFYLFSGITYTTKMICFYLQAFSLFGCSAGICFTLAIGIDRFLGVVAPVRYKSLSKAYVIFMILAPCLYSLATVYLDYYYDILEGPNRTVICFISQSIPYSTLEIGNIQLITLSIAIIISYALTWFLIWKKKDQYNAMKQILKALTVIMFIVILTWPIVILTWILITKYVSVEDFLLVNLYTSWIYNFSVPTHYFIFFAFSKDYRIAFLSQLRWIPFAKKYGKNYSKTIIVSHVSQNKGNAHRLKSTNS